MPIAIIRGPEPIRLASSAPVGVPKAVIATLLENAALASKTIALRTCLTEPELIDCLSHANRERFEFVMLDPGECACSEPLDAALKQLAMPYIEVHDDCGELEPTLAAADCGRPLNVIQGYGSQSYTVALSIALEHLGCAGCENKYNVGI